MTKRPNFTTMSPNEKLEYLLNEEKSKEQLYEWQSEPNACKECLKHDGKFFTLRAAPIMHPNCKCDLVATINGKKVSIPVGELSKIKYEKKEKPLDLNRYLEPNPHNKFSARVYQYWDTEPANFEELKNRVIENLIVSEGKDVYWPYLDSVGVFTFGPGLSFRTLEDIKDWKLYMTDERGIKKYLDMNEKALFLKILKAYRDEKRYLTDKGTVKYDVPSGEEQTQFQKVRMSKEDIYELMGKILDKNYKQITQSLKNAGMKPEDFSSAGMELFLNVCYHTGRGPDAFKGFRQSMRENDWEKFLEITNNKHVHDNRGKHYLELAKREETYQKRMRGAKQEELYQYIKSQF